MIDRQTNDRQIYKLQTDIQIMDAQTNDRQIDRQIFRQFVDCICTFTGSILHKNRFLTLESLTSRIYIYIYIENTQDQYSLGGSDSALRNTCIAWDSGSTTINDSNPGISGGKQFSDLSPIHLILSRLASSAIFLIFVQIKIHF